MIDVTLTTPPVAHDGAWNIWSRIHTETCLLQWGEKPPVLPRVQWSVSASAQRHSHYSVQYHIALAPFTSPIPLGPVWNGLLQKAVHVITLGRFQPGPESWLFLASLRLSAFCSRPSQQPSFFSIRRVLSKSHGFTEAESRWKGCVGSCDIVSLPPRALTGTSCPSALSKISPLSAPIRSFTRSAANSSATGADL